MPVDLYLGGKGASCGKGVPECETLPNNLFVQEFVALRTGMLRGLPDMQMASRFGEVMAKLQKADLEPISKTLMQFFASQDWRSHAEAHRRPARFL